MTRTTLRFCAALSAAALVAVAGPASAHVNVSSTDAAKDGFGKAVFRVPNESDTSPTTKLVVTLPSDTPFAFVSAQDVPGWTATVQKKKLDKPTTVGDYDLTEAVSTITWTADDGGGIPVGQFAEFALSGGPFPDADSISFAAEQTYADGEVVDWDQEQVGDDEPEHPAPTLQLSDAVEGGHGAHGAATSDDEVENASASSDADDAGSSTTATVLGGAALVVALAALVVALRQNRRRA